MTRFLLLLFSVFVVGGCSDRAAGPAPSPEPASPESDRELALRALQLPADIDTLNLTPAKWNGRSVLFADYSRPMKDAPPEDPDLSERPVVALWRAANGSFERADVTLGEHSGGEPQVAAIGFANADFDPADELIVMLTWDIRHYDVSGTMYGVVIVDDAKPGQTALVELSDLRRHFEDACDCEHRDGPPSRAQFTTISDVKAELKRLGY